MLVYIWTDYANQDRCRGQFRGVVTIQADCCKNGQYALINQEKYEWNIRDVRGKIESENLNSTLGVAKK